QKRRGPAEARSQVELLPAGAEPDHARQEVAEDQIGKVAVVLADLVQSVEQEQDPAPLALRPGRLSPADLRQQAAELLSPLGRDGLERLRPAEDRPQLGQGVLKELHPPAPRVRGAEEMDYLADVPLVGEEVAGQLRHEGRLAHTGVAVQPAKAL